jgi:hypothetical protein
VNRWLAVLSPVATFGVLSGGAVRCASPRRQRRREQGDLAGHARRLMGLNRWETEWAAHGKDLLRVLKAL